MQRRDITGFQSRDVATTFVVVVICRLSTKKKQMKNSFISVGNNPRNRSNVNGYVFSQYFSLFPTATNPATAITDNNPNVLNQTATMCSAYIFFSQKSSAQTSEKQKKNGIRTKQNEMKRGFIYREIQIKLMALNSIIGNLRGFSGMGGRRMGYI